MLSIVFVGKRKLNLDQKNGFTWSNFCQEEISISMYTVTAESHSAIKDVSFQGWKVMIYSISMFCSRKTKIMKSLDTPVKFNIIFFWVDFNWEFLRFFNTIISNRHWGQRNWNTHNINHKAEICFLFLKILVWNAFDHKRHLQPLKSKAIYWSQHIAMMLSSTQTFAPIFCEKIDLYLY